MDRRRNAIEWTAADQLAVDTFEREIKAPLPRLKGTFNPGVLALALVQVTGILIQQRLKDDPTRLAFYARVLKQLADHALPLPSPAPRRMQ